MNVMTTREESKQHMITRQAYCGKRGTLESLYHDKSPLLPPLILTSIVYIALEGRWQLLITNRFAFWPMMVCAVYRAALPLHPRVVPLPQGALRRGAGSRRPTPAAAPKDRPRWRGRSGAVRRLPRAAARLHHLPHGPRLHAEEPLSTSRSVSIVIIIMIKLPLLR